MFTEIDRIKWCHLFFFLLKYDPGTTMILASSCEQCCGEKNGK